MPKSDQDRWRARPWLAVAVRLLIAAIPLAAGFATTIVLAHLLRAQITATRWWLVVPAAVSVLVCFGVERLTRRLLPLAALLKLAMLFPDRAPSRFKVARRANSVRALRERLASELAGDAATAAEAALSLIAALTAHDRRTRGHCERVRIFTDLLGEQLRLPRDAADRLRWASLLHDIGKLEVAVEILNKPAKLDNREWSVISAHPVNGERLLGPLLTWLGEWGEAVRQHHEKYDGSGYPDGAAGTQISRAGRIVAIADAYEVMTAHRAYKKPMATVTARAELARCSGTQFDPGYVRAFLAIPLPRLLWAMGPGSLLMNVPLLRFAADAGNKGVLASSQTGVAALSAAAVLGGLGAVGSVASTPSAQPAPAHRHLRTVAQPKPSVQPGRRPGNVITHKPRPLQSPSSTPQPAPRNSGSPPPTTTTTPTPTPPPTTTPTPTPTPTPPPPAGPNDPVVSAPDAPGGATATAGDTQVAVAWSAPSDTGGAPLTGYTVTPIGPQGAGTPVTVDPNSTSALLTGLLNGSSYHFTVIADNETASSAAAATNTVIPAGAPGAPAALTAVAGDGQVGLTWDASDSNGSPLTTYTVTPRTGATSLTPTVVAGSATRAIITGLTDGTAYVFDVTAANHVGNSATSTSTSVTPVGPPSSPSGVTATAGDTSATVSWSAAADNGSAITGYRIVPVGPAGSLSPTIAAPGANTMVVSGLTNGVRYTFEVSAVSAIGTSRAAASGAVVPAGLPGAPGSVSASAGDGQATVFWNAANDNGSAISGYTVTPTGPGGPLPAITVPGSAVSANITGLANGFLYTFRVTATNGLGTSTTGTSNSVIPSFALLLATAPATPGAPTAVAGLTDALVSWTTPFDGLSPITGYTVTARQGATTVGSWQVPPGSTSFDVTGLTAGVAYSFTITADNAVGSSSPASTGTVTPVAAPGAPTAVSAVAADGRATVSWTAPGNNGGSAITGFTITPVGSSGPLAPISVGAGTTTRAVTGLSNGSTYTFEVSASNTYGTSPVATSNPVTPTFDANDDTSYVVKGGTVSIDVLSNDVGDLDPTTVTVVSAPAHGTAIANSDATITYEPHGGYRGSDHFTYSVCDTGGDCATATVNITVLDPGQHNTNFAGVDLHGADLHGVDFKDADLTNADLSGANLTNAKFENAILDGANLSNANLTKANLNNVTVNGATVLTGAILTGVTGGPAPKVVAGASATTTGTSVVIDLLSLTSDPNVPLDPTSIAVTKAPTHGTLVVHADGTATYTPTAGYSGKDTFTFSIANILTMRGSGSVQVTVG